jgi:hypothetical protein
LIENSEKEKQVIGFIENKELNGLLKNKKNKIDMRSIRTGWS